MIVFRAGGPEPKAVPLALVTRLEDLDAATFEHGDGRTMVQYRSGLMTIIAAHPSMALPKTGFQPILVFTHDDQTIGLAVDEIIDIVEEKLTFDTLHPQEGILGVAVLRGQVTEILDLSHYLSATMADWDKPVAPSVSRHIVLVERNPFFRNLLAPMLKAAGYDVEAVDTTSAALLCAEYRKPTVLLTDIDADVVAARRLLDDDRLAGTKIVALSGQANADATGFSTLVRKSDRVRLIAAVGQATGFEVAA
jgi:two-component system, chemotaxis family, sensor kinase CheA